MRQLLGWRAEELLGEHAHDLIHHSGPDGSRVPREECPFYQAVRRGDTRRELDDLFWRRDGSALPVVYTLAPLQADGEHVGAIVVFADVSERHRATELLHARAAQQAALADFGLRALGGGALHDLFQQAGAVIAKVLDVEFSQVLELVDERQGLRLVAGVGWRPGTVGAAHVGLDRDSQAGFALACDQPVVVSDWRAETRFRAPPLLREHGVLSGASVVIRGRDRPWGTAPWGVVGAHSRRSRTFTEEDINFLQSVANTLALAIERSGAEDGAPAAQRRDDPARQPGGQAGRRSPADHGRRAGRRGPHPRADLPAAARRGAAEPVRGPAGPGQGQAERKRRRRGQAGKRDDLEAIGELRNAVVALHPVTLARGGLAAAIKAAADVHARRGGFEVTLNVAPEAGGMRDQLIVSLAQELLGNVAQHAQASHVTISLRRTRDGIVFEVADDGRGMDPGRPREALERGHVGLASVAMRVESCGGRFRLTTNAGPRHARAPGAPSRNPGRRAAQIAVRAAVAACIPGHGPLGDPTMGDGSPIELGEASAAGDRESGTIAAAIERTEERCDGKERRDWPSCSG